MYRGNKMKLNRLKKVIGIFIIMITAMPVFSFTDQTTSERIISENRDFIEFINVCVSNIVPEKSDELKAVYQKHFNAEVAYMQSDYRRTFKRVYSSQGELAAMYEELLRDKYMEDSKRILDSYAPDIIRSKNPRARLYLSLGYRDRTVASTHFTVGEASNPRLFSYKLHKFREGIKMARRAKRYAFLGLFESQKPEDKRKIYENLLKTENESGNPFYARFAGKTGDQLIDEINISFEDNENGEKGQAVKDQAYENKLVKRVRFRKESRAARYMLDNDFDQCEDILREYIDDFNFKLILSTISTVYGSDTGTAGKTEDMKLQHLDNYGRLKGQSVIDGFTSDLKVEDDMKIEKKSDAAADSSKPAQGGQDAEPEAADDKKTSEDGNSQK